MKLRAGMTVRVLGRYKRKIERFLPHIKGGVELDRPIQNFSYWNVADIKPWRRKRK